MTRWTNLSILVAVLASAAPTRAQQAFRTVLDFVQVPVLVLARDGQPVHGLVADDFEVLENGRPQALTFCTEGAPGPAVPLHLGLMLDRSESMELELKASSDAAVKFVDTLGEAVDVTFVEFSTQVRVGRFSPSSYPQLFERIRQGKLGERTALYDAMGRYVETTFDRSGQHVLLVYTDGGDSSSHLTAAAVQDLLRMGRVLVYMVGYLEDQPGSERARLRGIMERLARETGGEAFFPSAPKDIPGIYAKIHAEIGGRYTLGYAPADTAHDGRFRKIEVRLRHPQPQGTHVRARSGYLAPAN
jgi:Ca-activated chloride channel homolog